VSPSLLSAPQGARAWNAVRTDTLARVGTDATASHPPHLLTATAEPVARIGYFVM
jgi:hypothetical protein